MVGTTAQKLTLTQMVAVYWLKTIDPRLLLFKPLKSVNQGLRLTAYTGLILYLYFFLQFSTSLIGGYFDTAPMADVWYSLGDIIYYGILVGAVLIFTLESVYKLDVAQILSDIKTRKQFVKQNKLQFWRLRNMHFFFRMLLYFAFYMSCLFVIQMSAFALFADIFVAAKNTPETHQQIALFIHEYESFTRWFTFLYFTGVLILDYFIHKKRVIARFAKAETEVQNENAN
jgi:hypothetical protein